MEAKDRLIVALDVMDRKRCFDLIDTLSEEVEVFKVGIAPFTAFGQDILDKIEEKGKKVFLDLKVHDIPNTVRNAASAAAGKNVLMMNFHCIGGTEMMKKAREGAEEGAKQNGKERPLLLGVTVLTSMSETEMREIGLEGSVESKVIEFAERAKSAGLDGVVASAKETKIIKKELGDDFIVVTPGIRPEWAATQDQKRIVTPKQAIMDGSDYIVVGRPIIAAEDPLEAAKKVLEEMKY